MPLELNSKHVSICHYIFKAIKTYIQSIFWKCSLRSRLTVDNKKKNPSALVPDNSPMHGDYKRFSWTYFSSLSAASLQRNATLWVCSNHRELQSRTNRRAAAHRTLRLQMLAVVPVSIPPSCSDCLSVLSFGRTQTAQAALRQHGGRSPAESAYSGHKEGDGASGIFRYWL